MKEEYNLYYVNAFSKNLFEGNPAGVFCIDNNISDEEMQKIATEIGYAETAFIKKLENNEYSLRWFSPKCEVPFCGHATLAAAKVVFEISNLNEVKFNNSYGNISARSEGDIINLEFPKDEEEEIELENLQELANAMGIKGYKKVLVGKNTGKLIFHLHNEEEVSELNPNIQEMLKFKSNKINGVAVTAEAKFREVDFVTRCFNPWVGIEEDYVTGSVHTLLGNYYSKLLNKDEVSSVQLSRREGEIFMKVKRDIIEIKGNALIFMRGKFLI